MLPGKDTCVGYLESEGLAKKWCHPEDESNFKDSTRRRNQFFNVTAFAMTEQPRTSSHRRGVLSERRWRVAW